MVKKKKGRERERQKSIAAAVKKKIKFNSLYVLHLKKVCLKLKNQLKDSSDSFSQYKAASPRVEASGLKRD